MNDGFVWRLGVNTDRQMNIRASIEIPQASTFHVDLTNVSYYFLSGLLPIFREALYLFRGFEMFTDINNSLLFENEIEGIWFYYYVCYNTYNDKYKSPLQDPQKV